jgi:hypothetical protein
MGKRLARSPWVTLTTRPALKGRKEIRKTEYLQILKPIRDCAGRAQYLGNVNAALSGLGCSSDLIQGLRAKPLALVTFCRALSANSLNTRSNVLTSHGPNW